MYIKVRVITGARKEKLIVLEDSLEVHVKEKPKQNMSNKKVISIVSKHYGAPAKIISGHHHPIKMLSVDI